MNKNYFLKFLACTIIVCTVGCSSANDEIEENTVDLSNGLVGKFDLNGNADDSSDFVNNGTIVGSVLPIQNRNGTPNSAMFFNESDGFIDVGNVSALQLTSKISISVWVNANGNQNGWDTIVNKWEDDTTTNADGIGFGYYLGLNPDGLTLRWNVTSQSIQINNPFPINEWTHIVVTFDGDSLKLYLNGILESQENVSGITLTNNAPFKIGRQSDLDDGTTGFNGGIDDIRVYNRALSLNEIEMLFDED